MLLSTVADIINGLRHRLDANEKLAVQSSKGTVFEMGFTFSEPAQETVLSKYPYLPADYQQFLRLHNGANFFTFEYGGAFHLHSIEQALGQYEEFKKNHFTPTGMDWFPIGRVTDMGDLCIDLSHPKRHVLLVGIPVHSFLCPFDMWLDRMVQVNGAYFWQWTGRELDLNQ